MKHFLFIATLIMAFSGIANAATYVCSCVPHDNSSWSNETMLLKVVDMDSGKTVQLGSFTGTGYTTASVSVSAQNQCEASRRTHPICKNEGQVIQ